MKKFVKNNLLGFMIGSIIFGSISMVSAYTTLAKDISYNPKNETWKVDNVNDAIDDLYKKTTNDDFPYVEGIWSKSAQSVNYTYTVEEDGIYIADGGSVPIGSISTTGEIIDEYSHDFGTMKVINAKKNDTITILGTNTYFNAGGYIVRIKNLDIETLITSSTSHDTTVTSEYTATNDNEKVLVIAFATGNYRNTNIAFTGNFKSSYYHANNSYIVTVILSKGTKVNASAYGSEWSSAHTYIFKLK